MALILTGTALILFFVANTHPFLSFEKFGRGQEVTILSAGLQLLEFGFVPLGLLVLFSSFVAPLVKLSLLLYVLIPLQFERSPWHLARSWRVYALLRPWGMLEVFMVGALISLFKLEGMATVERGVGFVAFFALLVVTMMASLQFHPRLVWEERSR